MGAWGDRSPCVGGGAPIEEERSGEDEGLGILGGFAIVLAGNWQAGVGVGVKWGDGVAALFWEGNKGRIDELGRPIPSISSERR